MDVPDKELAEAKKMIGELKEMWLKVGDWNPLPLRDEIRREIDYSIRLLMKFVGEL
jgi:hypothetical protein